MNPPRLINLGAYVRRYGLSKPVVELVELPPEIDLNQPGLVMHGSESDPYTILRYGLMPQQARDNRLDCEWQVCLGLNSENPEFTLEKDLSRKNPAVKYAGYFSPKGMVYVLSDEVKLLPRYSEYWDGGEDSGGYAWVAQPIPAHLITAVVTRNVPLAAAALTAAEAGINIYRPNGTCYGLK